LLQSDRDGSDDVFVMGANGSGPASLTRTAGHDGRPDWAVALIGGPWP
jgi:Tol biopolymer transport system component